MNDGQQTTDHLFAWISKDPQGIEGIITMPTAMGLLPLVVTDEKRARSFEPAAVIAARARYAYASLVRFDLATTLKVVPPQ